MHYKPIGHIVYLSVVPVHDGRLGMRLATLYISLQAVMLVASSPHPDSEATIYILQTNYHNHEYDLCG